MTEPTITLDHHEIELVDSALKSMVRDTRILLRKSSMVLLDPSVLDRAEALIARTDAKLQELRDSEEPQS